MAALAGLTAALLAFFLWLYVVRGFRFPVGPDTPVYLWWTRLAAHDGLSSVGQRPGIPALALVLSGTFRLSPSAVLAALECVLGTAVGLAAAALLRARSTGGRAAWIVAGALAGTFAVHLAAGYLANLAFGALFVAAAAALAIATRRATAAAAALLGAAGLAHPLLFLFGLVILGLAAAQSLSSERGAGRPRLDTEAGRIGLAAAGGAALLGAGLLALLAGPSPLAVDTSKDGFLRRAGLTGDLRHAYLDRFLRHWARYVQWASVPLAAAGLRPATGFAGRLLRAWGAVVLVGVATTLVTGWGPADRFVAFGYVIPILAALGLVRLWGTLAVRGRALAVVVTGALMVAMLAGAAITWRRQVPFISPLEVERATTAGLYAAAAPAGTPLVFAVDDADGTVTFLAGRAANVIRASLPPDRIRDAVVVVPSREGPADDGMDRVREALSRLSLRDALDAAERSRREPIEFLLAPFDRVDLSVTSDLSRVAKGVFVSRPRPRPVKEPVDPLEPTSPGGIVVATLAVLALLGAAGYGWARAAGGDGVQGIALAPAFGAAGLIVGGIALERIGVPLTGWAGPAAISASVGAGGYVVAVRVKRHGSDDPATEVDPQPHE